MQGPNSLLPIMTFPPGALPGTERIVIDGTRGAIFEYGNNPIGPGDYGITAAANPLVSSWASSAGTDPFGNVYPQGFDAGSGSSFTGTDFFINSSGFFFYSGTPALGNLIASITPGSGTDPFGNPYTSILNIGNQQGAHFGIDAGGRLYLVDGTDEARIFMDPSILAILFFDSGGINGNILMSLAGAAGNGPVGQPFPAGISLGQLPFTSVNPTSVQWGFVIVPAAAYLEVFSLGTPTVVTFTGSSGNFAVPAGVTSVKVECTGPGGTGGNSPGLAGASGGGGGGGEYAAELNYAVTPSTNVPYVAGTPGSSSSFNGTGVVAHAGGNGSATGIGGAGGTGSTNAIHFSGGAGGGGGTGGGSNVGGGGGSSAGNSTGGNAGTPGAGGGAGGAAPAGGAAGGAGGASNTNGTGGSAPGGGGGGAGGPGVGHTGGAGASGQVKITYYTGGGFLSAQTGTAQTDSSGNALSAGNTFGPIAAIQPSTVVTPEVWHNLAISLAGWATQAGAPPLQYRLVASPPNCVQLIGQISGGALGAGAITLATLPAGYRPPTDPTVAMAITTTGRNAINDGANLVITTAGVLQIRNAQGSTGLQINVLYSLDNNN